MLSKLERITFISLWFINGVSIFGYATFGLHPHLLLEYKYAPEIFSVSYVLFARTQMVLAGLLVFLILGRQVRFQVWASSLLGVFGLSLMSEYAGTVTGLPFGQYSYTDLLGPKILGHVPWLIPLSWYSMALPCFAIALRLFRSLTARLLGASLLLVAWDITLDPAMSHLTPFWLWKEPGFFYGMPLLNLMGWFVTAFALMAFLSFMRVQDWLEKLALAPFVEAYAVNACLPIGMCVAAGLWWACIVFGVVLLLCLGLPRMVRTNRFALS
jgi:uncharacterized membrane protein